MIKLDGILQCMGLLALAFLVVLAGTSSGQPMQPGEEDEHRELMEQETPGRLMGPRGPGPVMGVPVEVLIGGRGFALKDNETYPLRLNVERLMPLEPMQVRELLSSNKSLEEIREAISSEPGADAYQGSMMLDRSIYRLQNISLSPSDDNVSAVNADVAGPVFGGDHDNETAAVGSISLAIEPSEDGPLGTGSLSIDSGRYHGDYRLMLYVRTRDMPEDRGECLLPPEGDLEAAGAPDAGVPP